jgi:hypothetical protein
MKIFLSWSGNRSQKVAEALRDWLPYVVPRVEPYVSSEDIDKGARWATDIAKELEASAYGLICLTKENVEAPWVLFEAGALSKSVDKSKVIPVLLDLKKTDIQGPLLQFQAVTLDKDDVRKAVRDINEACGDNAIDAHRVETAFTKWWPELEEKVEQITRMPGPQGQDGKAQAKPDLSSIQKMMEEVLELSRNQLKILRSPTDLLPAAYFRDVVSADARFSRSFNPEVPPSDHPVWRDLLRSGYELIEVVRSLDPKLLPPSAFERLNELAMNIRSIARLLTRDMSIRTRYTARSRPINRDDE